MGRQVRDGLHRSEWPTTRRLFRALAPAQGRYDIPDLTLHRVRCADEPHRHEVGNVAVFLASDWARAVSGATIFADNGFHILGVTE